MDTEKIVVELVIPAVDWMQVFSFAETGLAFSFLFMAASFSAKIFIEKSYTDKLSVSDEEFPIIVLAALILAFPALMLEDYSNSIAGFTSVESDRLDELERKADSLDDLYGVDRE